MLQTIYTSLIDRTLIVLWRAMVFAAPGRGGDLAGAPISRSAAMSVAEHLIDFLNPVGLLLGLNGVILLAYIVAIPANEIVIPTILMLTVLVTGADRRRRGGRRDVRTGFESGDSWRLFTAGGWTLLTAVNLMLFSLIHNPCSTTIYTIYKETGSRKWTSGRGSAAAGAGLRCHLPGGPGLAPAGGLVGAGAASPVSA